MGLRDDGNVENMETMLIMKHMTEAEALRFMKDLIAMMDKMIETPDECLAKASMAQMISEMEGGSVGA